MCGIIAVLRRPSQRATPELPPLLDHLDGASARMDATVEALLERLDAAAEELETVDRALQGVPGVLGLLADASGTLQLRGRIDGIEQRLAAVESLLDAAPLDPGILESTNAALVRCRDATWAIGRDRLRAAAEVDSLRGAETSDAGVAVLMSAHQALSALDRLEVRGRDSAGLEVQLTGHGLDPADPSVAALLGHRTDRSFRSGAALLDDAGLVVVHKAAAEIGELGDNTAALRESLRTDELLQRALASPDVRAVVLGHTRWASIGIISEANAHPQSSEELGGSVGPFVTGVLNGDVDNYADLSAADALAVAPDITTDAKVIPTLVSRRLAEGADPDDAFRETVASLDGSVAIAATTLARPDHVSLALRGSGQAVYVGLAEDAFVVASEPYGVVEETSRYVRMDGETPSDPDNPTASRGQIISLSAEHAGTVDGISRWSYDGTPLPRRCVGPPARPGHDARHRPGELPALPAQGDHRVAGLVPQDPARQARRGRRRSPRGGARRRRPSRPGPGGVA